MEVASVTLRNPIKSTRNQKVSANLLFFIFYITLGFWLDFKFELELRLRARVRV